LLPNLTGAKLKAAEDILKPAAKEKDLYFKLLKEDRLDMLEIYLALTREAKILDQSTDGIGASCIGFQLAFEKWIGQSDFINMVHETLSGLKQILTYNTPEHVEITKYIIDPYGTKLSKSVLYRWLKVLKMPSSHELITLRKAISLLKKKGTPD
jgi:hypothetical protein